MIKVSIILCTYNRCQLLVSALESAAALQVSESIDYEIIVVDNNSNDQTRSVIEDFCRRYPKRFRYLFERQQGKSHALNAGMRNARGDILAFMDDDVTVEPTWLENLVAALHDSQWAGCGGRILPIWTCPPPRWLPLDLAPLAMFDLGPEAGPLTEPPFGANMAFRKVMFERYGTFRTDLGPRPGSEIRSEDTEFGARLLAAGERLRYEPTAVVHHGVCENRLQRKYFLDWWFAKGRANIREFGIRPKTKWYFVGIPLYLFRNLGAATLQWITAVEPNLRFSRRLAVWSKVGEIAECYRQRLTVNRVCNMDADW